MRNAGIAFTVQPADVDETPLDGEQARECAERLAREKALAVWRKRPKDAVLGADTVVVVDGHILGKPVDAADAARMLRMLSGRDHRVITGVCLASSADGNQETGAVCDLIRIDSATTTVTMREILEEEIREYVATSEPMDKAGAYAIQGIASRWIPRIEGDYCNVVGLPVALVDRMLNELKVP